MTVDFTVADTTTKAADVGIRNCAELDCLRRRLSYVKGFSLPTRTGLRLL